MEQFRTYSPEDIILSNLEETSNRLASVFEQELAHLSELAKELIDTPEIDKTSFPLLSDILPPFSNLSSEDHLATNNELLYKLERIHSTQKKLLLGRAIRIQCGLSPNDPPLAEIDDEQDKREDFLNPRIVYPKNSFTDSAYLCFASLFPSPRALYAHSYVSSCEDVFNGIGELCILPIENAAEGRLIGFLKLINRFGLRIIATCDISSSAGDKNTAFALLSQYPDIDFVASTDGQCRYLEIAYPFDQELPSIAEVLTAAQLCGLHLKKIHTLPSQEASDGGNICHAVFEIDPESDPTTFLIYLAMEVPQYSLVGIYPHLQIR